jgi:transcription elongation factor
MAKEKRLKSKADISCKKLQNKIELSDNSIKKELTLKSERLNENLEETRQDASYNKHNLKDSQQNNADWRAEIQRETKYCEQLEERCKMLKSHVLFEDKNRSALKSDLIQKQKVMNSAAILQSGL